MRNKLTKFLTSECPPKGMRQFAKTWKYAACMLLSFILGIGQMWADVLWESDMQASIDGVTQTSNKVTYDNSLSFAWAADYTKGLHFTGSSAYVNLAYASAIELKEGDVIRFYTGCSGTSARTLSLFLNNGSSAVATQSVVGSILNVLEYKLTADLTLNSVKVTCGGSDAYLFKMYIYRDAPATGETTISCAFTYKGSNVKGWTNNCITTISGFSTSLSLVGGFATSGNNGLAGCSGEITGQPTTKPDVWDKTKYADIQFTIADGYTFTPTATSFKWSSNNSAYEAKIAIIDENNEIESNVSSSTGTQGTMDAFTFASDAFTGKKLSGSVHLRIYMRGANKRAWLGSPFTITGTVASAVAPTNYTVTIDPNGGSYASTPDGWTYDDVADKYTTSIASGTSFTAPTGLAKGTDDLTWKDGSDNDVTFPVSITSDITFVAQWAPHTASSNANLSALAVAGCTLNETFDPATTVYTISLPFYGAMPAVGDVTATKDDANAATPEVSISGNVITVHCVAENGTSEKDYTITVNIAAAPAASTSVNIEQNILDNWKTWDFATALAAAHITVSGTNGLDSLNDDPGKKNRNYGFLGLKFNKKQDIITIVVPAEKVLNVKFGQVGDVINVSANGVAQATVAKKTDGTSTVYHLDAAVVVREVIFTTTATATSTLQQVKIGEDVDPITLPWLVTYDAGDGTKGTCTKANEVWTGTSLTLPAVTPVSGWNFDGWNDGTNDYAAGDSYTPTANVTMTAQYSAIASGTDLDALTYQIGTGAATAVGYTTGTHEYTVKLPYAGSYDAITVAATPVSGASIVDDVTKVLTVTSLPGDATFTITDGVNTQLYTVHFVMSPKDGVSIIKAIADDTNQDIKAENLTGLYKKAGHIYTSGSYKLDQKRYFMVQLEDGKNFQEGDVVEINVSSVNDCNGFTIYSNITGDDFVDGDLIVDTHDETGAAAKISEGINKITLPSYAGSNKLYVARKSGTQKYLNAGINQVEVKRAMNPVLTAIQFNDTKVDVTGTTIAATLPNGTDLGAMTITPTIVWNGAGTAVAANTWEWSVANTYTVTDKDGDATVYTITLTEAVPAVDPTLIFNEGAYMVGASALDLSTLIDEADSDGEITYTVKTDGGTSATITDGKFTATAAGTATITATQAATLAYNAKTVDFNVVVTVATEIDGIKLVEAGALTGNFVSARTLSNGDNTIEGIAYTKYLTMSSTMTSFGNEVAPSATKGIYYYPSHKNIRFYFYVYNNQSSAKKIYIYTVDEDAEGTSDATSANVSVDAGRHMVYADVELTKHAAVVFGVENTGTQICQIVAVESGDALLQGGEAGYSIDYNKCYISPKAGTVAVYDGIEYKLYADAKLVSAGNVQLQTLGTDYIKFHLDAPMTVNVYADNKKYYIGSECSTDDAAMLYEATGDGEFSLAAGDWYINGADVQVKINKLSFTAPKCAEPVIDAQPASKLDFAAGDMTASVTAHATDGGTLKYQWYKAEDDSEVTGQTTETLTTTEEGTYYVIVTNKLADHADNFVKSDNATLKYRKADDATLSALTVSEGTLDPIFDPAVLEYNVTLPEGTVDVPTLTATAAMAAYGATADVTNAAAFVNYEATSTVLVTAEDHSTQQTYTVHFYVDHTILALVDVTGDMTWDFSKDGLADGAACGNKTDIIMANVDGVVNNDDFHSDNIMVNANKQAGTKLQASMIMFHTTVDGLIKVVFSNTGDKSSERYLVVNGKKTDSGTKTKTNITYYGFVPAGDVVLTVIEGDGNMLNFASVQFTAKAAADLARDAAHGDDWMAPGELGTVCIPNGAVATGGDLYELVGKNEVGKIVFATVPNNRMTPGVPYLFQATSNAMKFFYTEEATAENPDNSGAMKGTFGDLDLTDLTNVYYFAGHALWGCSDLTSLEVKAYRAWVVLDDNVSTISTSNPAPGRRYITMEAHGQNAATGIGNVQGDEVQSTKVLINGQLFILRGEKMYDATGRLVK